MEPSGLIRAEATRQGTGPNAVPARRLCSCLWASAHLRGPDYNMSPKPLCAFTVHPLSES